MMAGVKPTTELHLGVCQTEVLTDTGGVEPWLARIAEHPEPGLWLFPELVYGGFDFERAEEWLADTPLLLKRLHGFAQQSGHALAAGLWERRGEYVYNTLYVFSPDESKPAALSRKAHLFPMAQEAELFCPGRPRREPLVWRGLRLGGAICYDLRFPEIFRSQAAHDVDVFLVPAQWPEARIEHFTTLARARAIENQCFVLGCNGVGGSKLGRLGGGSICIDPWGEVRFRLGQAQAEAVTTAARADIEQARDRFDTRCSRHYKVMPHPPDG
jgi:predicted amidohydrolase